jgi:transposase
MPSSFLMKTIAKINPEKEYQNAKNIIEAAGKYFFNDETLGSLNSSLENLITATRVLIEREEKRRGIKKTPKESRPKGRKGGDERKEVKKLPSERYPHIEVREDIIFPKKAPKCPCCNKIMKESGVFDVTEKLEVIPKQYYIQRNKRPKFNCGNCHGAIVNTPAIPSIIPCSNYGDSLIIDATLSKFCYLIPIERYIQMAFRNGLEGLPPQSVIGLTHNLADFFKHVYLKIKS